MSSPYILSIAFNYHDSSIALSKGNEVLMVLEAERIFRKKKLRCSPEEMNHLIETGLKEAGLRPEDITMWCGTLFGNNFLGAPDPILNFEEVSRRKVKVLNKEVDMRCIRHHRAHASFFFGSPFEEALVISCDGGGDSETHEMYYGKSNSLEKLAGSEHTGSFSATFYDRASYHLYRQYRQEGKFMGLASWGNQYSAMRQQLEQQLSVISNLDEPEALSVLSGIFHNDELDASDKNAQDFAAAVQLVFENARVRSANAYRHLSRNLVLVGGSALNVVANTKIAEQTDFENIWVPPCPCDTGQALGALLHTIAYELQQRPAVRYPFLGLYGDEPVSGASDHSDRVIELLLQKKVLVWHQGRAEVGPRALGHRSLLALPCDNDMRILVSEIIKGREFYRPVAPIIPEEELKSWFEINGRFYLSPYMSFIYTANNRCREAAPAVVHVDGTARVQTVSKKMNELLWKLLMKLKQRTGVPILINTSLNSNESPICESIEDTKQFINGLSEAARKQVVLVYNGNIIEA
jgi:carbamoyltransferase